MEQATVIHLSPGQGVSSVSSFEDAFGEHSEFKGKGRKRRQARRQERRMTRVNNRAERRKAKRAMRQDALNDRLERRRTRKAERVKRKAISEYETPQENESQNSQSEASENSPQNSDASQESAGGEDNASQNNEESEGDDSVDDSSDDEEDDSGFDGSGTLKDPYSLGLYSSEDLSGIDATEVAGNYSGADGKTYKVHPKVQKLVIAVEKAKAKVKECIKIGDKAAIEKALNYLEDLEDVLADYHKPVNANGRSKKHPIRTREVSAAKRNLGEYVSRRRKTRLSNGGSETPVEKELNPSVSDNRIEVDGISGNSNASGTGLNGIDNRNDYDSPGTRTIELSSNADGAAKATLLSKINWKYVAVGAAIAIAGIWAYKKYGKKK